MEWIKEQWKQIRGHAKWELLKTLGTSTMIASLYGLLQKLRHLSWDWWVLSGLFSVSFVSVAAFSQHRSNKQPGGTSAPTVDKLVIYSALYGTGPFNDVSVTERLRTMTRDALVIPVDNNLVAGHPDPAPNQPKRLLVEYSYNNSIRRTAERQESRPGQSSVLILPEDEPGTAGDVSVKRGPTPESAAFAEERALVDQVRRMSADEIKNKILHEPEFKRRFDAIPKNKYRSLPEFDNEPDRYTDTLEKRARTLAKSIREFMRQHGPEPEVHKQPGEENASFLERYRSTVTPWRDRVRAGYSAHFKEPVRQIRDEFAERDLVDNELNEAIIDVLTYDALATIATRLRFLAAQLED